MNNKLTQILIAVLIGQACLALALNSNIFKSNEDKEPEKIVSANLNSTDTIKIEEKEKDTLELVNIEGQWSVPGMMNFPASKKSIDDLLKKFRELKAGWPVASSKEAAKRFKVTKDDYEKKISFISKGKNLLDVYLGSSASFRSKYLRCSGSDKIYSVEIQSYEFSTKPKEWIDKTAYTYPTDKIQKVATPAFTITSKKDKWVVDGIKPDETTNQATATNAVSTLSGIVFKEVEGDKPDPEYGMDSPEIEYTIQLKGDDKDKIGKEIKYTIGKRKVNDGYILKASDKKYYVSIDDYVTKGVLALNKNGLTMKKKPGQPAKTEKKSDSSAAAKK